MRDLNRKREYQREYNKRRRLDLVFRERERFYNMETHYLAQRKYNKSHPEVTRKADKHWRLNHPIEHQQKNRRRYSLRNGLGYTCLNLPFPESHGHHINKEIVIYIPKYLHKSISHNLKTGYNMEKINKISLEWFLKGEV